jgi:asparagine synthase (glutamine-hydrolysing)
MCGIAGIIYFNNQQPNPSIVKQMTEAMAHRGPDATGLFSDDQVVLGQRRLSILDLSDAANQPFADAGNRYQMVYNGEIYNYAEVKQYIKDHRFRTSGDTEVLIEAYARKGLDCIHWIKGMFAFAIWDTKEKSLCIVRDRMGVKPLYYYQNNEFLIFASECRAILATGLVPAAINEQAVVDYLSYQSVYAPLSIIEGIQQLEAGHALTVKNKKLTVQPYWQLAKQQYDFDYTDTGAVKKKVYQLLENAVVSRLVSDVPVGAFLSGGIDSSAVVALMATAGTGTPNTFSIGFTEKEYDESAYAQMVATKFKTNHHPILLKPTVMLEELEHALNAMDSPSGDGINSYVVSKAVKSNGITVALSGMGGDELFAGYPFFTQFYRLQQKKAIWNNTGLLRNLVANAPVWKNNSRKQKMLQLLQTSSLAIESVYPVLRNVLPKRTIRDLLATRQSDTTTIDHTLNAITGDLNNYPIFSQVTIAELMGYTQQTLLKDTDQFSMAVSLEVREPFFDHELVSFVLGIPDALKYPHYPKQLLVESLGDLLPPEIVHRKKQGFVFPWDYWLRNELRSFCEQHLKRLETRSLFNAAAINKLWKNFLAGNNKVRWMDIWLLVVLEYWLNRNLAIQAPERVKAISTV